VIEKRTVFGLQHILDFVLWWRRIKRN